MSTMPTTVSRVRRAATLDGALAVLVAILLGFVLGFASQALGAEETEPAVAMVEAIAALDEGVVSLTARKDRARKDGDEGLARCIGERLLVLRGARRALRNAEQDVALARLRDDENATALAAERGKRARQAGTELLAEARGCASEEAILGRANGVTYLRVTGPQGVEDRSFGPPEPRRKGLGRR